MLAAILGVWALFVGLALMMMGAGLQGALLGLRATAEGFGIATTGVVMSAYYLGFLAGSRAAPGLVRRVGHIRVFAALAALASTAVLVHALLVTPIAWFLMRFFSGLAFAGLYVIVESWLNHASTNETRGKMLSFYTIVWVAFTALGQQLLNVADPNGSDLFIYVSILVSLSLIPISLTRHTAPPIDQPRAVSIGELYRASPLGFVGCLVTGFAQGAFFSLAAVYATLIGFDVSATALFIALPLVCVVLVQWPVGALSDRYDRRVVLTTLAVVVALLAIINVFATLGPVAGQLVAVAAFGGVMIPLYAMSIAQMNDHLEPNQMLGASSKLVFVYGVGSAFGPVIVGWIMNEVGPLGFFWSLGAIHLLLGIFALWRMTRRGATPQSRQGDFVLVVPKVTPIVAGVAMEIGEEGAADRPAKAEPVEAP